jgi:hypothetical protein
LEQGACELSAEFTCNILETFDNLGPIEKNNIAGGGLDWSPPCDAFELWDKYLCPQEEELKAIRSAKFPLKNPAVKKNWCIPIYGEMEDAERRDDCIKFCTNFVSAARGDCCGVEECTSAPPASQFNIQLVNMGPTNTAQRFVDAFTEAKARWESIIVNDLGDFPSLGPDWDWFSGLFSSSYTGDVDDVVIGYAIEPIDGRDNILGFAGPTWLRNEDRSPISGIMKFDIIDFTEGTFSDEDIKLIIMHEMGR